MDDTAAAEEEVGMVDGLEDVEMAGVVTERCVFGTEEEVEALAFRLVAVASPCREDVAEGTACADAGLVEGAGLPCDGILGLVVRLVPALDVVISLDGADVDADALTTGTVGA